MGMRYIQEFISVLLRHRIWAGVSILVALILGVGFAADYPIARNTLRGFGVELPAQINGTVIILALLVWLVFSLTDKETMRRLRAGRIIIEGPQILQNVPLYGNVMHSQGLRRERVSDNDIIYAVVKNQPFEMSNGKDIERAFGSISITNLKDGKEIVKFDYPRWMDNEKPGYQNNPSDRYVDDWNFRTIYSNGSPNRLDLIVKNRDQDNAYGFRGPSQLLDNWHDNELTIPPGRYKIMLTLSGKGMREPYLACYEFINHGKGKLPDIRRTDKGLTTQWLQADT